MNINSINTVSYKQNNIMYTEVHKTNCAQKQSVYEFNFPYNYYNLSFGRKTPEELIKKIGEENFPSPVILEKFRNADKKDHCLYDIHTEHYKELADCKTLEEAKEKYPELSEVKEAKDVKSSSDMNILNKIEGGGIKGLSLENLSLELLKRHYCYMKITRDNESYFGLNKKTVEKLFDLLHIKKLNIHYINTAVQSKSDLRETHSKSAQEYYSLPERRQQISERVKKVWDNDDGSRRSQASHTAKTVLHTEEIERKAKVTQSSTESRERKSIAGKESWERDDGTRRLKGAQHAIKVLHSPQATAKRQATMKTPEYKLKISEIRKLLYLNNPERREEVSKRMKLFYKEHPEYIKAQKLAWERHPEFTKQMQEIAKSFPNLGYIIRKKEKGIKLSDEEDHVQTAFYKKCSELMPGYYEIIGQEYHNILVEWGLKEE